MTKITYTGGATTEFAYDGLDRRVRIVEKSSGGTITSEKRFVWDGLSIAEERDASNAVTKHFYPQGQRNGTVNFYYSTDHLGSIREMTDSAGAIETRYDYDPYGRVTKTGGSGEVDFRYTGHYFHATSGLHLAPYRAYDADLGRWLSRDPIEEKDGPNLYAYVGNDPINLLDALGLRRWPGPNRSPPVRPGFQIPWRSTPSSAPAWSPGPQNNRYNNLQRHWNDHPREFPEFQTAVQYARQALQNMRCPPTGSMLFTKGDQIAVYQPNTNTLTIGLNVPGVGLVPQTMFRPAPASATNPRGYNPSQYASPGHYVSSNFSFFGIQ